MFSNDTNRPIRLGLLIIAFFVALIAGGHANAHTWQLGWEAQEDGSVDFYGVAFHDFVAGTDNFDVNPAGVQLNSDEFRFEFTTGSGVALGGCSDGFVANVSTSCDDTWNALGLDDSIASDPNQSIPDSNYGQYVQTSVSAQDIASAGLVVGDNVVNLTAFGEGTWGAQPFAEAANITVIAAPVPEPPIYALLALGLLGMAVKKRLARP